MRDFPVKHQNQQLNQHNSQVFAEKAGVAVQTKLSEVVIAADEQEKAVLVESKELEDFRGSAVLLQFKKGKGDKLD